MEVIIMVARLEKGSTLRLFILFNLHLRRNLDLRTYIGCDIMGLEVWNYICDHLMPSNYQDIVQGEMTYFSYHLFLVL